MRRERLRNVSDVAPSFEEKPSRGDALQKKKKKSLLLKYVSVSLRQRIPGCSRQSLLQPLSPSSMSSPWGQAPAPPSRRAPFPPPALHVGTSPVITSLLGVAGVGGATSWKRTLGKGFEEFHSAENPFWGPGVAFPHPFTATTGKDKSELTRASGLRIDVNLWSFLLGL